MLARDRLLGTYEVRRWWRRCEGRCGCRAAALTSLAALRLIDAPNGRMNGDYGSNMGYYTETSAAKFEEEEEEEEAQYENRWNRPPCSPGNRRKRSEDACNIAFMSDKLKKVYHTREPP